MEFERFLSLIPQLRNSPLGGVNSHLKMIPKERTIPNWNEVHRSNPKKAAVMALFYPDSSNQTQFLLIQRAEYHGTHSAQISLPGGKFDHADKNLETTALRETYEEVGISMTDIEIKVKMTETYISPSNFLVTPFMGILSYSPLFKLNHEVKDIIEVQLTDLLSDLKVSSERLSTSYMKNIEVPCFRFQNNTVWGATAMMLSEIKDLIQSNFH